MSKQIEAMKLALDALEYSKDSDHPHYEDQIKAITALREALAEQPAQQEPLGYIAIMALNDLQESIYGDVAVYGEDLEDTVAIYTTPQSQQWPMTNEMVTAAARALNKRQAEACGVDKNDHWKFFGDDIKVDARAVLEAAYGITKDQK